MLWIIGGWAMMIGALTVLVETLAGMDFNDKPQSMGGLVGIVVVSYFVVEAHDGLPGPAYAGVVEVAIGVYLLAVAILVVISRRRPASTNAAPTASTTETLTEEFLITPVTIDVLIECDGEAPTKRRMSITQIESPIEGNTIGAPVRIKAFCHLRKTMRTFRVNRIIELVDADTGEVADDPEEWLWEKARDARSN